MSVIMITRLSPYAPVRDQRSYTRTRDLTHARATGEAWGDEISVLTSYSACGWLAASRTSRGNFCHERAFSSADNWLFRELFYPRMDGSYYMGLRRHPSRAAHVFNIIPSILES